jgi:hypothetical protein
VSAPDNSLSQGVREPAFQPVRELAFEAFGVRIGIRADHERAWERLPELIPPHSRPCHPDTVDHRFSISSEDGEKFTARYDVRDGVPQAQMAAASYIASGHDLPFTFGMLEEYVRSCVGMRAPDRIFIHGGAVGFLDRMIIMPGEALTGKSTLAGALVRAGASYYSDEFVVFDEMGRVHPYATELSGITGAQPGSNNDRDRGGLVGGEPLPVGAIVLTSYRPGAGWSPRRISAAEGLLAVMGLIVPAHERPEEAMHTVRRAFDTAPLVVAGDRGEADEVAPALLAEVERHLSASG